MGSRDHLDIWEAENAVTSKEQRWLAWISKVESLMGHSPDGDQAKDGYSMDWFYDLFEAGTSPEQASVSRYFPI